MVEINYVDGTSYRAAVCNLLSGLWAKELALESPLLKDQTVAQLWTACGGVVASADSLECLAEEYCRLFIGPRDHLVPCQSVWKSGELQTEVVSSFGDFAAVARFTSPWPELLPDHLANVLDLYALLLDGLATETSNDRSMEIRSICRAFAVNHIAWAIPFLHKVEHAAREGFYRNLALVTRTFLNEELAAYPSH